MPSATQWGSLFSGSSRLGEVPRAPVRIPDKVVRRSCGQLSMVRSQMLHDPGRRVQLHHGLGHVPPVHAVRQEQLVERADLVDRVRWSLGVPVAPYDAAYQTPDVFLVTSGTSSVLRVSFSRRRKGS